MDPNLFLWLTGPDPGGPKTYGSYLQSLGAIRYIAIPHTVAVEEEIQSKNIEINSYGTEDQSMREKYTIRENQRFDLSSFCISCLAARHN